MKIKILIHNGKLVWLCTARNSRVMWSGGISYELQTMSNFLSIKSYILWDLIETKALMTAQGWLTTGLFFDTAPAGTKMCGSKSWKPTCKSNQWNTIHWSNIVFNFLCCQLKFKSRHYSAESLCANQTTASREKSGDKRTCMRSFLSSSICLCVASCSIFTSAFIGTLIFTLSFLLQQYTNITLSVSGHHHIIMV